VTVAEDPLQAHRSTPAELQARISAERGGRPFLLYHDDSGDQRIAMLAAERLSVGRAGGADVELRWDAEVSRLHAELERIAGEWTVSDDGLSRNGTFVNGERVTGRHRLRDGDLLRVGRTVIAFRDPGPELSAAPTRAGGMSAAPPSLTPAQRAVLVALARPYAHDELATPATNQAIADELHLSVDAVKSHLRLLFQRFGVEDLPQNRKRAALVARALRSGAVSPRELADEPG
jgi:pSer/pThr/pTyr-binding forkhead associated (FHA) protein